MIFGKMKPVILIVFLLSITLTMSIQLDGCLCQIGSKAHREPDGTIKCSGSGSLQKSDCLAKAPSCLCSGQKAQILENDDDIVCAIIGSNNVIKKWPCENKEDWLIYLSAKKQNGGKGETFLR